MHIAFDFDGVIGESGITLAQIASKKFDTLIRPEDLYLHGLEDQFCIPKDEAMEMIDKLCSLEYTMKTPLSEGAKEVIKKFHEFHGFPITIVTARKETSVVEEYLYTNIGDHFNIFYQDHGTKSSMLKTLGVDMFVEDFYMNIVDIVNNGIIPILYVRPWNKYCFTQRSLINRIGYIVRNWYDIEKIFFNYDFKVYKS